MTEAIGIAVLNFVHETVTFLPNDTSLDDVVHDGSPARGEALLAREPRSYMTPIPVPWHRPVVSATR